DLLRIPVSQLIEAEIAEVILREVADVVDANRLQEIELVARKIPLDNTHSHRETPSDPCGPLRAAPPRFSEYCTTSGPGRLLRHPAAGVASFRHRSTCALRSGRTARRVCHVVRPRTAPAPSPSPFHPAQAPNRSSRMVATSVGL